jgi:hypothetical protein
MRELRGFVELFDKNDVKNLFDALSSCIEYVRMDLYIFDSHVACLYSNDLDLLSIGNTTYTIVEVPYLFEAFMEYASPELKAYYDELTKEV